MARREKSRKRRKSLRRTAVKKAVSRTAKSVKKVASRLRPAKKKVAPVNLAPANVAPAPSRRASRLTERAIRPVHRKPDVPLDVLNRTYSPTQTSLKASFRSDGEDHQRDQELAEGYVDERWNDEDHFTNKSGDPRIGTHRRKYEPNE